MNLIWGLNLIASKIGVGQFPPIFFTALRFGSLALFLVPMLRIHRGQMTNLFAAAMLTGPAAFALLFTGIYLAEDAATVAVASQMGVPFSTLMSVWLLGETIRWRRTLGIVLAFGGIVIISFDPRVFAYWEGLALVVASSFVSSLGLIFLKRLKGIRAARAAIVDRARRRPDAAAAQPDARRRADGRRCATRPGKAGRRCSSRR